MAEEGDAGEKSEDPTSRRQGEARKEGQVGVSTDLSNVTGITAAFIALQIIAPYLWADLQIIVRGSFTSRYTSEPFTAQAVQTQAISVMVMLLPEILLLMVIAGVFGAGCTALQNKFLWSWKLLKPKLMHINPITGIKKLFSINNTFTTIKSIVKLIIIGPIAYMAFFDLFPTMMSLMDVPKEDLLPFAAYAAGYIFWRIIALLLILAIVDCVWQKWRTYTKMKMSKQEVKDEKKSVEGDEGTRRRIIAIGMRRARERMMQEVPTADVVVTNPTHLAVALSYSMQAGSAPKVVAKGRGYIAERIKKIAKENGVPVVEKKPLARALFKMVEVGHEIPYELFKAVAEILAYVYRLKGKLPSKASEATQSRNNG